MTHDEIVSVLIDYLHATNPLVKELDQIPLDQSLYELGILDSYAVIEMVDFIEKRWSISILDSEITKEKFGGINKMTKLIGEKIAK